MTTKPRYYHEKSGGTYDILGLGFIEASMEPAVVYQSVDNGLVFIRPALEFFDGRFKPVFRTSEHGDK